MWKLAMKDVYLLRRRLLLLLITAALMVGILVSFNNISLVPALFIFSFVTNYAFSVQICYYEDQNKSLAFLRGLPITAAEIVTGRFLALGLVATCALLLGLGVLFIFKFAGAFPVDWGRTIVYALSVGLVNWLLNCLAVLVYFRWGFNRMRFIYALTFTAVFIVGINNGILARGLPDIIAGIPALYLAVTSLLLSGSALCFVWYSSVTAIKKLDLD